jgi:hypothetical protein
MKNEIIFYSPSELAEHIEDSIDQENETFWINQYQSVLMNNILNLK